MMPGDVLDVKTKEFISRATERVTEANFRGYMESYVQPGYRGYFSKFQVSYIQMDLDEILERLRAALLRKLSAFILHDRIRVPLYSGAVRPGRLSAEAIDFRRVNWAEVAAAVPQVLIIILLSRPAWQIARILDGHITWEEVRA